MSSARMGCVEAQRQGAPATCKRGERRLEELQHKWRPYHCLGVRTGREAALGWVTSGTMSGQGDSRAIAAFRLDRRNLRRADSSCHLRPQRGTSRWRGPVRIHRRRRRGSTSVVRRDRPQTVIDCQLITSWITRSVLHISDVLAGTLDHFVGI